MVSVATGTAGRLHLLRRTTFGLNPRLLAEAPKGGQWTWLDRQLDPGDISDGRCDEVIGRFPHLRWSIPELRQAAAEDRIGDWDVMFDVVRATIARALWSRRQLFEVMVDFWSNHLNVTCPSSEVWDNRHRYDADVIRAHALGRYSDMLRAAIHHPAMLRYLGNVSSTKNAPNENLGRELLELHSVGVEAGYTEEHVRDSARILTGMSVDWSTGEYLYRPTWHAVGPVTVLDFSHANGSADGRDVVTAYLDHLARHPATARRLARKLAVRFVRDTPSATLVDRLAQTYLDNDTEIVPVLIKLFTSAEFAASTDAKTRRPAEALLAAVRTLDLRPPRTGVDPLVALHWMLSDQGQVPLAWPQPDGYPDVATSWQSAAATLTRWNCNLNLAAGWWPKTFTRDALTKLIPSPRPATHGGLVSALGYRLHQRRLTTAHRDAICAFLQVRPSTPLTSQSAALTWRLPYVVALLLDAPATLLR
jgi:uncharacterized protein (DUF1800 family)